MQHLQQTIQYLLDLLFPPQCAGCQCNGTILCSVCTAKIQPIPMPFCQHCHTPLSPDRGCRRCAQRPLRLSGLRCVSGYQEPLRSCIHALKYDGVTRLAQPLGECLAQTSQELKVEGNLVLPVPLHPERLRRRGYNHAALLARICAQKRGIEYREDVLSRSRNTSAQARLSPEERARNVAGAFRCTLGQAAISGKCVILIDDVCTTGATLEECATPLFAAGASSVWGLVLACSL
jgi:ComF family protein